MMIDRGLTLTLSNSLRFSLVEVIATTGIPLAFSSTPSQYSGDPSLETVILFDFSIIILSLLFLMRLGLS